MPARLLQPPPARGWTLRPELTPDSDAPVIFEKAAGAGWVLRKYCRADIDHPEGKGVYYDRHALVRADSTEAAAIIDRPDWEWADLDGKRLVWTEAGRLHAAYLTSNGLKTPMVLHDLNDMTFSAIAAPY